MTSHKFKFNSHDFFYVFAKKSKKNDFDFLNIEKLFRRDHITSMFLNFESNFDENLNDLKNVNEFAIIKFKKKSRESKNNKNIMIAIQKKTIKSTKRDFSFEHVETQFNNKIVKRVKNENNQRDFSKRTRELTIEEKKTINKIMIIKLLFVFIENENVNHEN